MIGLGLKTHLYTELQRKNPTSSLLNENFWALSDGLNQQGYEEIKLLLRQNRISEAEMLIKNAKDNTISNQS